jgi:membrane associated rhomboid family serine protease
MVTQMERNKLLTSVFYPLLFTGLLWIIHIASLVFDWNLVILGVFPLKISGLKGILFSPLIHSGFQHLISNTFPLLILGTALFFFYKELGIKITVFSWLMSGVWVWVFAREAYHIGASGIIYAWAGFLFVSGVIRGHPRLMAISLLVAFLYGGIIWGIFPIREQMSWEGHLMGLIAGIVLAMYFRNIGPQRKVYIWELEEEEEQDDENPPYWMKNAPKDYNQPGNENKTI